MKNLLLGLIATVFFASLGLAQSAKISYGIDPTTIFVPSPTFPTKDLELLRTNANYNTFYELSANSSVRGQLYTSIKRTSANGKTVFVKYVYDKDGKLSSAAVSSENAASLGAAMTGTLAKANPMPCVITLTIFNNTFDIVDIGCIVRWLTLIFSA